jgi:cytochrome c-type biogenesis protein CcmH
MLFWILAAIVLAVFTFIACLPLFRTKSGWTPVALALVFLLPVAALMIYKNVGAPEGIDVSGSPAGHASNSTDPGEIDDMVASLRAKLTESREDLEGWILLSRTLKTMQRYPEALEALETAHRIAPDDAFVMVELVEARIFLSPDGRIDDEMISMLQNALTQEPGQQKALWLMGVAASQAGENEAAISYWESLLEVIEPDSSVAQQVQEQIALAQGRMGMAPQAPVEVETLPPPEPVVEKVTESPVAATGQSEAKQIPVQTGSTATWTGTSVRVSPSETLQSEMPSGAVLYVMIRAPGPAVGPPIGVRRIQNPALPLEITINDQDSMLKGVQISALPEVQLQARLSLSGSPGARSGDWQSNTTLVPLNSKEPVKLLLDEKVE